MGNKTNCLMEKIILKKSIHYINYTTILSQLNMMDIPDNIKQVNSKIRNGGENLKRNQWQPGLLRHILGICRTINLDNNVSIISLEKV